MPNLGFPEIMLILVVALLVFGPKKLPDLGRSLGNGIREFRRGTEGLKAELGGSMNAQEVVAPVITEPVRLTKQADAQVQARYRSGAGRPVHR